MKEMSGKSTPRLPAVPSLAAKLSGTLQVLRLIVGGVIVTGFSALLSVTGYSMWLMVHRLIKIPPSQMTKALNGVCNGL